MANLNLNIDLQQTPSTFLEYDGVERTTINDTLIKVEGTELSTTDVGEYEVEFAVTYVSQGEEVGLWLALDGSVSHSYLHGYVNYESKHQDADGTQFTQFNSGYPAESTRPIECLALLTATIVTTSVGAVWLSFASSKVNKFITIRNVQGRVRRKASNALSVVKRYVAVLSQTGTNDPVVTVLENSLGDALIWTRESQGRYKVLNFGLFPVNKTFCMISQSRDEDDGFAYITRVTDDLIYINTFNPSYAFDDQILGRTSVEIRVYP